MPVSVIVFTLVVATVAVVVVDIFRRKARRETFIRTYMFPRGVFEKLTAARPGLALKDQQLVARALRQFFLTFLKSGGVGDSSGHGGSDGGGSGCSGGCGGGCGGGS